MRYYKENGENVINYTEDERSRALEVSLTSLAAGLGYTPVRQGRYFSLKEMDSLVIYDDKSWYRWSGHGNRTGGTQIDFLMEFAGISSVPEAINYLLEFKGEPVAEVYAEKNDFSKEPREFILPPQNENYKRLYAYLIKTRGLSAEVITDFVQRKLIYEDAVHHNIVYCGRDPEGVVRYAGLRGTADAYGKTFKMDVPGNDKNYGVNIVNKKSNELKVFEAVIDCMSYIDIYKDVDSNKLVLGMVEDTPLIRFLQDYSHIKRITFCLDNDKAAEKALYGDKTSKNPERQIGLVKKYEEQGYIVNVEKAPYGKDYNECLNIMKGSNEVCKNEKKIVCAEEIKGYISEMSSIGCTLVEKLPSEKCSVKFFDLKKKQELQFENWEHVKKYVQNANNNLKKQEISNSINEQFPRRRSR